MGLRENPATNLPLRAVHDSHEEQSRRGSGHPHCCLSWQLPGILRQHRNLEPFRLSEGDGGHADELGANIDLHHEHRRESREQGRMHAVHRRQKRPYTVQAGTGHHCINPVHRRDVGRTGEAERPAQHGYHLASGKISKGAGRLYMVDIPHIPARPRRLRFMASRAPACR